ncbi:hypothetical protein EK21DRAFT_89115 [Setomelanomma holmii]|uniref:FHA domain-containing protein n=1 Tax=Setomelanomma holmii TaxID=210430 RepID=A0A9P4H8T7_9PLEO|nr:hypothetical protein EK21DRAFT_89115 [Setomelanomma holmii]
MTESEFLMALYAASPHANRLAFRIVLRDAEGFEEFDARDILLPLGASFPVGRASRNSTKPELAPAANNAYIDSPVISRDHAKLSAHAESGTPQVYISDSRSMHGTMVNGERLAPHTLKQLSIGDLLQFGVDVNRNEEFFVARKYTFDAHLDKPQATFSQGFTVPDSDEEEVAPSPPSGSRSNPLTIGEADSDADTSDREQHENTVIAGGFSMHEARYGNAGLAPGEADGNTSSDEGSAHYSSDYPEDEDQEDIDSAASLVGDSEIDYNSDPEVSDIEAGDVSNVADNQSMGEPESDRTLPVHSQPSVASRPPWAIREFSDPFDNTHSASISELPSMKMVRETIDSHAYDSLAPPLPPRPTVTNTPWFTSTDQRPNHSSEMSSYPNYLGTNHGDRPSLFSSAPLQNMLNAQEAEAAAFFASSSTDYIATGDRIQTPPPMPTADVTSSTSSPPSRRTMLSIDEIVEEQPMTPESVNDRKRKADVLEVAEPVDTETLFIMNDTNTGLVFDVAPNSEPAVDTAAQTAATIAQRPKKQPKSIVSRVRNTVTYLGYGAMGAAGAVALLSYLPDAFFA